MKPGKAILVDDRLVEVYLGKLATTIRMAIAERNIDQREISAATGISQATISRVVNGRSRRGHAAPLVSTVIAIALSLGLLPSELMP